MVPSLENRQRIALLVFFVGDHLLWYYGGHFEQVSLFYVVLSETIRILGFIALVISFFYINCAKIFLFVIIYYCYAMLPLNIYGGFSEHPGYRTPTLNLLWFKSNAAIPIESSFLSVILYMLFLVFLYLYVFKPAGHPLLKQQ